MYFTENEDHQLNWRKSRRSWNNGACVEAASLHGTIAIRDSQDASGLTLSYPAMAWRSFVREARTGLHDPRRP
jgi:hypothetical protein